MLVIIIDFKFFDGLSDCFLVWRCAIDGVRERSFAGVCGLLLIIEFEDGGGFVRGKSACGSVAGHLFPFLI